MTTLRDYQTQSVNAARDILYKQKKRSVVLQSPTGSGKTAIVSAIMKSVLDNNQGKNKANCKRVWFIVPRRELVKQTQAHFAKWGISFGIIDANHKESRAYNAQIVSLQTLMRRLEKIKEIPDLVFFDECYLNYDAQQRIMRYFECAQCEKYVDTEGEDKIIESVPLVERPQDAVTQPITFAEKREIQDAVIRCVREANDAVDDDGYDKAVKTLCDIADKLKYRPMWVYHRLTDNKYTVNTRALHSIAKAKDYHPYWAKKEADRIRGQLQDIQEETA